MPKKRKTKLMQPTEDNVVLLQSDIRIDFLALTKRMYENKEKMLERI